MALEDYKKALRLGQKEYRSCVSRGVYPYPQVLDDILVNAQTRGEVSLGLVDLPTERIFGTKTAISCPCSRRTPSLPPNGAPSVTPIWKRASAIQSRRTSS